MTPRTLLLITIGILVYFSLSIYHSRQLEKYPDKGERNEKPGDWVQITTSGSMMDSSQPEPFSDSGKNDNTVKQSGREGKVNILRQQLQTASEEKEKLNNVLEEERSQNKNLKLQVDDLHSRLSHQQSKLHETNTQLHEKQQALEKALSKIVHLTDQNTGQAAQLQEQEVNGSQLDSLKKSLISKAGAVSKANKRIAALSVRVEQLNEDLAETNKSINRLQSSLAASRSENTKVVLKQQMLEEELARSKAENEMLLAKTGGMHNRLKELNTRLALTETRLSKTQLKAEAMFHYGQEQNKKFAPSSQKIEKLLARVAEQEELLIKTEQKLDAKQAEIENLTGMQDKFEEVSNALGEAEQRIESLSAEMVKNADNLLQKESFISELNSALGEAQTKVKESDITSEARKAEISNLKQSVTNLQNEKAQLQEQVNKTTGEHAQLTANNKKYQAEVQKFSRDLQSRNTEFQSLLSQQEKLQAKLKETEIAMEKMNKKLEQKKKMEQRLKGVQKELTGKNKKIAQAEDRITELDRQNNKNKNSLAKAETTIKKLEASLQEGNRKNTQATEQLDEIRRLKDIMEEKDAKLMLLTDENFRLSGEIQTISIELDKIKQGKQDRAGLYSELGDKSNRLSESENQLRLARQEIEALNAELENREKSFFSIRDEFFNLQARYDSLTKEKGVEMDSSE